MSIAVATDEGFGSMARQMGKILEQLNKGYYSFSPNETWTPNVNLYETARSYQVCVDLAGVDKEKIDIEVVDHRLSVRGTRAVPIVSKDAEGPGNGRTRVHLMEIDHGSFARLVELPHDVDPKGITAEHRNGILWIEIPKK
ncbi:MAG: Hsp20/alpha crystallin family protein [Anaerolineae bacterium]|nr:Hsp20/alpha crystallin family protein [Phycisphaerae bacterium]